MVKKKTFIITVLTLVVVVLVQMMLLLQPMVIGAQEVSEPEVAVVIAKSALAQKYRDDSFFSITLYAMLSVDNPGYWHISEGNKLGHPRHVLVRCSDGKVILKWTNNN